MQDFLADLEELLLVHTGAAESIDLTDDSTFANLRRTLPFPTNLNTQQAAVWLGVANRTLERWRCTGQGPPFVRANGRVIYRLEDLEAWIAERTVTSTAEAQTRL